MEVQESLAASLAASQAMTSEANKKKAEDVGAMLLEKQKDDKQKLVIVQNYLNRKGDIESNSALEKIKAEKRKLDIMEADLKARRAEKRKDAGDRLDNVWRTMKTERERAEQNLQNVKTELKSVCGCIGKYGVPDTHSAATKKIVKELEVDECYLLGQIASLMSDIAKYKEREDSTYLKMIMADKL